MHQKQVASLTSLWKKYKKLKEETPSFFSDYMEDLWTMMLIKITG